MSREIQVLISKSSGEFVVFDEFRVALCHSKQIEPDFFS